MNKKGFTLIEILIMMVIIGLLSTFAILALSNAKDKYQCEEENNQEACDRWEGNDSYGKKRVECDKIKSDCRYICASNEDNDLDDCTKRCEIKYDFCIDK